jgi:hypothetical protein
MRESFNGAVQKRTSSDRCRTADSYSPLSFLRIRSSCHCKSFCKSSGSFSLGFEDDCKGDFKGGGTNGSESISVSPDEKRSCNEMKFEPEGQRIKQTHEHPHPATNSTVSTSECLGMPFEYFLNIFFLFFRSRVKNIIPIT